MDWSESPTCFPSTHRYIKRRYLPLQKMERRGTFLQQTPIVIGPRTDLVHTFNRIPVNRNFVVSAEMELPRYLGQSKPWQMRMGLDLLASERCRGILPLSDAARASIARRFQNWGHGALREKMTVFREAISAGDIPENAADQTLDTGLDGPLQLLFVGGGGLRKGLKPTLEVARRCARAALNCVWRLWGR
jgi:hypothetical protein